MFLKNFSNLLTASMAGIYASNAGLVTYSGGTNETSTGCRIDGTSITTFEFPGYGGNEISNNSNYSDYSRYSLAFGCGTREPAIDDYCLENSYTITDNFEWKNCSLTYNGNLIAIVGTIANISDTNLTVSEIGIIMAAYTTSVNQILVTRDVISPVTIAPGDIETFTCTMDVASIVN